MNRTTGKFRVGFINLSLIVITLAVFWQVSSFDFLNYDDNVYVTGNPHILRGFTWENIVWVFTHEHGGHWHPLTGLSHMLDCQLFDLNPGRHHLTSLLLHIANTLLLFAVFRRATGALWQSAFVAALFAIHPLHVESVAWVADRKDVLSTVFWILTIGAYFRYAEKRSVRWYAIALVLFALGLMAKPMLVTLPFVLLLLDYWPLSRLQFTWAIGGRAVLEKIPFLIITAASSIVTFFVFTTSGQVTSIEAIPVISRVSNAVVSYVKYIEKLFVPTHLAVFYPYSENIMPRWLVLTAAVLLVIITICVICFAKKHRYLFVGWFWYLGTLVPVIGLLQIGDQAMADRYTYVPLIGLFIIIVWGATDLLQNWRYRKTALKIASTAVVLILSICTWIQTGCWRNSQTLFEHAVKVTNGNSLACNNLGMALIEENKFAEAVDVLRRAIQIKPDNMNAYTNLGTAYAQLGHLEQAIKTFKQAIKIKPDSADAYNNLGSAYGQFGRYKEAIEAYEQAIKIKPDSASAYNNLGAVYGKLGRYKEEVEAYKKAIQIKPDYAQPYNNLGAAYGRLGGNEQAIQYFQQAVKIEPDYVEAYDNLALTLSKLGRYRDALQAYMQVVKIIPDDPEAHFALGIAYLRVGDRNSAAQEYQILQTLDPEKAGHLLNLISK